MKELPRRSAFAPHAVFVSLLLVFAPHARAQTARARLIAADSAAAAARPARLKRLAPLKVSETAEGTRVTIAADAPLDDYSARREGAEFVVTLPQSELAEWPAALRGEGFDGARADQEGDGLRLAFRLREGFKARAAQSFTRLDILFTKAETATKNGLSDEERAAMRLMLRRVEELEARVKELEAERAKSSTNATETAAATSVSAPPVNVDESAAVKSPVSHGAAQGGHDDHDAETQTGPPRLQVQGYADINLRASNERGRTTSFALGQLDLFLTSKLSEKFSVLSELIIEADQNNEFSFEIHRLLLRYAHNDYLTLSAGRYHSAIGYWNTAYHHGSWFQTTADRPFIFQFEGKGGILPLHNVGVSATGRVPGAPWGMRYIAEVGNGRASRSPLDRAVQTAVDENNGKAFNVGLYAKPREVPGLQAGFSLYRDRLTPQGQPFVNQTVGAAYVVYNGPRLELLNEAVFVRHESRGRTFTTPAFYTLVSHRFGDARPFFRYQYTNVPGDDPIYPTVGRRNGPAVGLRYDVSQYAALKAQYEHTSRRRLSALDELILQLSFTF